MPKSKKRRANSSGVSRSGVADADVEGEFAVIYGLLMLTGGENDDQTRICSSAAEGVIRL